MSGAAGGYHADSFHSGVTGDVRVSWIEIALLLVAMAWIGAVVWGLRTMATPTQGASIAPDAQGRAVMVIGVQEMFTRGSGRHALPRESVDRLIAAINTVAARAGSQGIPVLYVRSELAGGPLGPLARLVFGTQAAATHPGGGLDPALADVREVFSKQIGDAFSNDELDGYLRRRAVGEVMLMGLDGIACVQRTARGALNRGYRVTLLEDGIVTGAPRVWRRWRAKLESAGAAIASVDACLPPADPSAPAASERPSLP